MRILQISALCLAAVTVVGCAGIPVPVSVPGPRTGGGNTPGTGGTPASIAADVVRYTNEARTRNGRPALLTSSRLMEAARIHAAQMATHQRSEHTISGARYPTLQSRLEAVGYVYANAAENVAWNQPNAQSVVNGWMNSSGHRTNILDPQITEIGAAIAYSSRGEPYWIQVFGRPRPGT
jgi:uncharacterized protein YkwD